MNIQEFTSYSAAENEALRCIQDAIKCAGRATVLVSSFFRTEALKETLAKLGLGFGVKVETLNSWIDDLWELYGDGRACVDVEARELIVRKCLELHMQQNSEAIYSASNGVVSLVSEVLRTSAPAISSVSEGVFSSFSAGEKEIFTVCKLCLGEYAKSGIAERSEMCAYLKDLGVLADECIVLFDVQTTFLQDKLLESAAHTDVLYVNSYNDATHCESEELTKLQRALFATQACEIVNPTGDVRFALPAGKYAENRTIFDELRAAKKCCSAQTIAVASADPIELFEALSKPLSNAGFEVCVDASVSFVHTDFGAAWITLMETVTSVDDFDAEGLADFALSAFSFTSLHSAYKADAFTRSCRGVTLEDALVNFEGAAHEEHRDFMAAIAQGNYKEALHLQYQFLAQKAAQSQNEYIALQRDAAWLALESLTNSENIGLSIKSYIEYLKTMAFVFCAKSAAGSECVGAGARENAGEDTVTVCPGEGGVAACPDEAGADTRASTGADTRASTGSGGSDVGEDALTQRPRVLFTKYKKLAECEPESFDVVLLADLTEDNFSFAEKEQALDFFLQKIGSFKQKEHIVYLRKQFSACVAASSKCLILERVLNNEKADPNSQSALLEQLIDCYRQDATAKDDLIKGWLIPKQMEQFARSYGEKEAIGNMLIDKKELPSCAERKIYETGYPQLSGRSVSCLLAGKNGTQSEEDAQHFTAPTKENSQNKAKQSEENAQISAFSSEDNAQISALPPEKNTHVNNPQMKLSASAIECYLECQFKWFAQRRIGMDTLGTDFSALEKGTFIHGVMKDFHETLTQNGMQRVTQDNASKACEIMDAIFDKHVRENEELPYGGTLVALNQFELLELRLLKRNAIEFVKWEANLTPNFKPRYNEYEFGKEHTVEYAGVLLTGSIDRIDEDECGNIIIYDYKSKASDNYSFYSSAKEHEFALPKKIQALVYAQIARRELGKNPVGALYIGYDNTKGAAGLYNLQYLREEDVCGAAKNKNATEDFLGFLDRVEEEIALRLKALSTGAIAPSPRDVDVCKFCNLVTCTMRGEFNEEGAQDE
jgi:ATP-dependent helicase/nuclease subunit B